MRCSSTHRHGIVHAHTQQRAWLSLIARMLLRAAGPLTMFARGGTWAARAPEPGPVCCSGI